MVAVKRTDKSMRLLNTKGRLPGGWRYEQFDAAGKLLHKWKNDFDPFISFLNKVRSFRVANKLVRQDINFVEADVTEYLAREFGGDPKYFTREPAQKKTTFSSHFQSRSAKLVARGRQLLVGINIGADWLGDGLKPVEQTTAQDRCDVCKSCPRNNPGFKPVETIADIIRLWSEKKNEMTLSVNDEDKLHTCDICWCHLPTKVWVPMETIVGQTPKSMFDKFAADAPEKCWMRRK